MGGSKENRHTPGVEHWSLAVENGKPLEEEWRTEIPIPRGGPHRFDWLLEPTIIRLTPLMNLTGEC